MTQNKQHLVSNLTFVNWNANGIKQQRSTLIHFMARHGIDVACVTETHLIQNEKFTIPGYQIHRKDQENAIGWGGSAIIIRHNLAVTPIDLTNVHHLEAVAINLVTDSNTTLRIISAYKPPNNPFQPQELQNIF
jgi:exonuclease III